MPHSHQFLECPVVTSILQELDWTSSTPRKAQNITPASLPQNNPPEGSHTSRLVAWYLWDICLKGKSTIIRNLAVPRHFVAYLVFISSIRVDPGPRNRGPTSLLALKIRTPVANTGKLRPSVPSLKKTRKKNTSSLKYMCIRWGVSLEILTKWYTVEE
jgi:hypothetical protein